MAHTLIRLSGKPHESAQIQFTGLREGEKLEQELFYHQEKVLPTSFEKIKRINCSKPDWSRLCCQLEELRTSMSLDRAAPIRSKIKEIVPEYTFHANNAKQSGDESLAEHHLRAAAGHD
jgi:FlaA1/EpsC-like NDP-sugar epimerase